MTKVVEINYPEPVIDGDFDLTPIFEYTADVFDDPSEYCPPIICAHMRSSITDDLLSVYFTIEEQNKITLHGRALVEGLGYGPN